MTWHVFVFGNRPLPLCIRVIILFKYLYFKRNSCLFEGPLTTLKRLMEERLTPRELSMVTATMTLTCPRVKILHMVSTKDTVLLCCIRTLLNNCSLLEPFFLSLSYISSALDTDFEFIFGITKLQFGGSFSISFYLHQSFGRLESPEYSMLVVNISPVRTERFASSFQCT